jgi:uncharacterized damage-inducible protein DinB
MFESHIHMPTKIGSRKELDSIKECYRYNSYVHKKYLDALEKLSKEELVRDRGASFPSMLDIFVHVLDAYRSWTMYSYPGLSMTGFKDIKVARIDELREEERKVDSFVLNLVEGLEDETIDETFESSDGTNKWRFTIGQMLWHLIEEELQHRSELNALFWQLDLNPPHTDWLDWKIEIGEIRKLA